MIIKNKTHSIEFDHKTGGFPSIIKAGTGVAVNCATPMMSIITGDNRRLVPFLTDDFQVKHWDAGDTEMVEFAKILWRDCTNGSIEPDFYLSLSYEIWRDGTVFVDSFFMVEKTDAPDIKSFSLEIPLRLKTYGQVKWGYLQRPLAVDGSAIQSGSPQRFLDPDENMELDGAIVPLFNFNCAPGNNSPAVYMEFFMEGHNSLSGKVEDTLTRLTWIDGDPCICWEFQSSQAACRERPWQWRNRWGWLLTNPPIKRSLPPLWTYHYLDNYQRYPDNNQLDRMISSGADLLILHENWRLDAQNGGIPYNYDEFNRVKKRLHDAGVRLAVYMRGAEASATERFCDWFPRLLQKNFDGLYMDYGGPVHGITPQDECFPGGSYHFRQHYLKLKKLRETVGKRGVLLSHTGPVFSALGQNGGNVDCYVAGEGEGGVMVRNRLHHTYFSAAYALNSSMWTAAFPEYGTKRMVPFLAANGQTPHVPLGVQFENSSLSHPRIPGINDLHLRPLWKLWGLFKDKENINIYNDYNCDDIFCKDDMLLGHYLMADEDLALLTVSNFSDKKRCVNINMDLDNTCFKFCNNTVCWLLEPNEFSPGKPEVFQWKECFPVELEGYGLIGILLSNKPEELNKKIKLYSSLYIPADEEVKKYLNKVEEQKYLRNNPPVWDSCFLQLSVENLAVPYEESMWWDLYYSSVQIGLFDLEDNFKTLGWISGSGFSKYKPLPDDYIWPGHSSLPVNLNQILPSGINQIGLMSIHAMGPFYSFANVSLAPSRDMAGAYSIKFMNELEPDRSCIRFQVNIK